jgi:hypothetical protein
MLKLWSLKYLFAIMLNISSKCSSWNINFIIINISFFISCYSATLKTILSFLHFFLLFFKNLIKLFSFDFIGLSLCNWVFWYSTRLSDRFYRQSNTKIFVFCINFSIILSGFIFIMIFVLFCNKCHSLSSCQIL